MTSEHHYQGTTLRQAALIPGEPGWLRAANLDLLESWHLDTRELDLPGEHPALGPVTLRQLLAAWAVHDLGHVAQVARVMGKQYAHEVGPWVPFLPVLTDNLEPRS